MKRFISFVANRSQFIQPVAQRSYFHAARTSRGVFTSPRWVTPNMTKVSSNTSKPCVRSYATYRTFDARSYRSTDWNKRIKWFGGFTVLGGLIYVTNLEPAPVSGRKRFMIVSRSIERMFGDQAYEETLNELRPYLLPDHHPEVQMVKDVMRRIIRVCDETTDLKDLDWKVHVVDHPSMPPNAMVLPGGKVFVFRRILPICANKDGLATVLSHETAHQVARHSAEHLSQAPIYWLLGIGMYMLTGSDVINQLLINSLLQLPASREMEREADYIGLMLMSKACFDPTESVRLWQRMSQYEQQISKRSLAIGSTKVPEFLSTHPSSENRIVELSKRLPEAEQQRELAGCNHNMSQFWSWN